MSVDGFYYDFFQKTKCSVFILKENSIYYANSSSLKLFGYNKDEILSLHPSELSPKYQFDGKNSKEKANLMISIAIKEGSHVFEWQHSNKNGEIFWTEIVLTPIFNNDELLVFALIKDIGKRKEYEQELNKLLKEQGFLLKNIADFIYKIDENQKIKYVSDSVINVTGYSTDSWLEGLDRKITSNKLNKNITKKRKEILSKKQKSVRFNVEILNKNGERLILELIESYYENDEFLGIIGVAKDITERYRNEMILLKSQKMELISSLSSGLVHDLNNTLSIILGNTDLISRAISSNKDIKIDNLENIKSATQKANDILNHLLTISQKQSNIFNEVDLNDLIMGVFSILRNSFNKTVSLELNLFSKPALLKGDKSQLEHMLLNILINSYQAIFSNGKYNGVISLSLSKVRKASRYYWLVNVNDDGVGIPKEMLSYVFDPFFTTKGSNLDLGLGLTSTKNIIEGHDGYIEIDSEEGKGTNIKIYLPVDESFNSINEDLDEVTMDKNSSKQKSILIIDDEPLIITTVTAILEEFNYEVLSSLSGDDGVKLFKDNLENIGLVILDMDMPNKSGKEVFYELKSISDTVKVIISSGYENDKRVQEILKDGVKGFIAKPYNISSFISKIESIF